MHSARDSDILFPQNETENTEMNHDLNRAIALLSEGNYTCVACHGDQTYTATFRGVKPLVNWLDDGVNLTGFSAADKVVGKATAYLYCLLGVRAVHAHIMSTPAMEVLRSYGIDAACDKEVPGIINRQGNGPCPFEAAVWDIHDPAAALEAIHHKQIEMNIR